jgi:hypothetical protein
MLNIFQRPQNGTNEDGTDGLTTDGTIYTDGEEENPIRGIGSKKRGSV